MIGIANIIRQKYIFTEENIPHFCFAFKKEFYNKMKPIEEKHKG